MRRCAAMDALTARMCQDLCQALHRGCRSSTYAKPGGPKSDPRPVSDKAYQANCIRVLIAYLSTHGYDQPLAPKLLTSPMSKDVTHIVQFLMRQVRWASSLQMQPAERPLQHFAR